MGHRASGPLQHTYCILFRSLDRHEVMVQISGGSVKLGR